jgi:hypothetical protein
LTSPIIFEKILLPHSAAGGTFSIRSESETRARNSLGACEEEEGLGVFAEFSSKFARR